MIELKPCPFCGSNKVKMYSVNDSKAHGFIHLCSGFDDMMVKIESRLFPTEEDAVNAWNRRAKEIG